MRNLVMACMTPMLFGAAPSAQVPTLRMEREIVLQGPAASALAWSPDRTTLAIGSPLGDVVLVDARSGAVLRRLAGSGGCVGDLHFSRDGRRLYVLGADSCLCVWSTDDGRLLRRGPRVSWSHAWSRDGELLASMRDAQHVEVLRAQDLECVQTIDLVDV